MVGSTETDKPGAPAPAMGRVLKDSTFYLLGNVASRIVGFLAIPFYSRFLSPAQYGLIELIELSTQTVAIAFGLQAIGAALGRLFHDQKTPEGERSVVSTSLIATGVLSAVVTLAALAASRPLSMAVFHSDEWVDLLRAAFVAMFFSNLVEVVLVYERIRNNARFFLAYQMSMLVGLLGLNILFIGVFGAGVWGFIISKLVVSITGSVFLAVRTQRDVGLRWRYEHVPELVRFGAPLVLSSLSYFLIHFSDRLFLSTSVTLADLGRYGLAYRFAFLIAALVGDSFSKSWSVTLYRYIGSPDWREQFTKVASYLTYLLFATAMGIALFSPELLRVMVPPDYFPPPLLLPILLAAYLVREIGDFFRSLLLINKRSGMVGKIAAGGAGLNIAANWLLIPTWGIYGAAVATFITWFVYTVVCWIVANREHHLPVNTLAYLRITTLAAGIFALAQLTRGGPFIVQALMDGLWLLAFCGLAAWMFLSRSERGGVLSLAGNFMLWTLSLGPGGPSPRPGPHRPLLLDLGDPAASGIDADIVTATADAGGRGQAVLVRGGQAMPQSREHWGVRSAAHGLGVLRRVVMPHEDRLGWLPRAYALARRLATADTVVVSSGPPAVTHLVALALQHRHGTRWIAELRATVPAAASRTGWRSARIDPVLERLTVENADAVLVPAGAANSFRARYPGHAGKVHGSDDRDRTGQLLRLIDQVRAAASPAPPVFDPARAPGGMVPPLS